MILVRLKNNKGFLYSFPFFFAQTIESIDKKIKEGKHILKLTFSPKFKIQLPEIKEKKRSGLRIHYGVKPTDSKGCILIPDRAKLQEVIKLTPKNKHLFILSFLDVLTGFIVVLVLISVFYKLSRKTS